jgi:polysaccharide export outer membrane protein
LEDNSGFRTQEYLSTVLRLVFFSSLLAIIHSECLTVTVAADGMETRPVYTIRTGDQLLITVVGYEKELTALVVVRPDGMVTYPVVGDVKAAGLTIAQLSSAIGEKLSDLGYYESPQVTVQLRQPRQEIIYVSGDVKDPGQKTFPGSANVIEVLAAAGWFAETADLANARIIKKRKEAAPEIVPIDLEKFMKKEFMEQGVVSGELFSDRFMLSDGDVLVVPSGIREERVNIIGRVHASGQYQVKSEISLVEALALAGGALEGTADLKHIRIIRADDSVVIVDATRAWSEKNSSVLPSHPGKDTPGLAYRVMVQPGDSVFVPEKGKVNILGSVQNQGKFDVDGEISIIEALTLAGIDRDTNLKKLRIVRSSGEQVTVDASKIWSQQVQEYDERLTPGDTLIVPRSMRVNWGAISTVVLTFSTLYAIFR